MSPIQFLDILLQNLPLYSLILVLTTFSFLYFWKKKFKKYINGLLYLQATSVIVFTNVIFMFITNEISYRSLLIFIGSEIFIISLMCFAYLKLLKIVNLIDIDKKLNSLNNYLFILIGGLLIVSFYDFYLFFNVNTSESRLSHKVNTLYSFVRILSNFVLPPLYILLFHNIHLNNKFKSLVILLVLIMSSIFTGSKSGFIVLIFVNMLLYKDLTSRVTVFKSSKVALWFIIFSFSVAIANIVSMEVDFEHMIIRIIDFAEAPIMVLPFDDPGKTIFLKNSYFSIIYRSFGKLIEDPISSDLSSLFGFRLHEYFYGSNTLVGPNARIGALFYSFFERPMIIISLVFISISVSIISRFHYFFNYSNFTHISFILIVVSSYTDIVMDYNTATSNFATIIALFLFSILFFILKMSYVKSNK